MKFFIRVSFALLMGLQAKAAVYQTVLLLSPLKQSISAEKAQAATQALIVQKGSPSDVTSCYLQTTLQYYIDMSLPIFHPEKINYWGTAAIQAQSNCQKTLQEYAAWITNQGFQLWSNPGTGPVSGMSGGN